MYVKIYHYHIDPVKEQDFMDLQKETHKIYSKHVNYKTAYFKSRDHQTKWVEIHWYPDHETYLEGISLINQEPKISELWEKFNLFLDPEQKEIMEQQFDQIVEYES